MAQSSPSMNYIHEKPASVEAKIVMFLLNLKKLFQTKLLKKQIRKESRATKIPKRFFRKYVVDTVKIEGRDVYLLSHRNVDQPTKCILYIHGGAYVENISIHHWHLVQKFLDKTQATFIVPDYPLAPKHEVSNGMDFMEKVYNEIVLKSDFKKTILMGDSAGGGFSLAFSQKLKNEKAQQPSQIILLAPWLDISTSKPEMKISEKLDPILTVDFLKTAGKSWSEELDSAHHLVSPINGDLSGLGEISLFIGGRDILFSDTKELKGKLENQEISFNYFEYPKMFHVWMAATFLKESKFSINQIAELINNP